MREIFGERGAESQEQHWLSVSDLMAGLMMVFLLIAVALMQHVNIERDRIKEVAVTYQETQVEIYEALVVTFAADLLRWDARIDKESLAFEFRSPEVLFPPARAEITPRFAEILTDFFPRYVAVLGRFKDAIEEIRIEGHSSSEWDGATDELDAYFENMRLSQDRTRSVLEYVSRLPDIEPERAWVKQNFAAVGFSSSRAIFDVNGFENKERSRRVVFRVKSNAEIQIRSIIQD